MEKNKILWICHFSNSNVREKLPLTDKIKYADFSPWISNLINEFEFTSKIDLHIISPHRGMLQNKYEFKHKNIHYYFFKPDLPIIHKMMPSKFYLNKRMRYLFNRYQIKKFTKTINPDLINLIGAENPYYSISVLDIKHIPIFLSCQTVYSNPIRKQYSDNFDSYRWDIEKKIHKKINYFGCQGRMHRDLILDNNPNAIIFKMFFPINKLQNIKQNIKKYDFVFFAGIVSKKKGIEDAIDALFIVKDSNPNVSLNIVGKCPKKYKLKLINKINELKLEDNITFNDFFSNHSDMHSHITKSKFALLPNKLDVISTTIIESIQLGLPIVSYKTTGSPYLNKYKKSILLSNIGDIKDLANNMINLLENTSYGQDISQNAKEIIDIEFNNTKSIKRLIDSYRAIISHYYNEVPIPKDTLFSLKEFPIYE